MRWDYDPGAEDGGIIPDQQGANLVAQESLRTADVAKRA
jgi:hypothetical protein